MQEFLSCPEQGKLPAAHLPAGGTVAARFVGDVTWGPGLMPVLSAVNFTAHRGELVMIVGATGSGKTAMLYGLLGLTDHVHGNRVTLKGSCAFVSQQAFIFGGAPLAPPASRWSRRPAPVCSCTVSAACGRRGCVQSSSIMNE